MSTLCGQAGHGLGQAAGAAYTLLGQRVRCGRGAPAQQLRRDQRRLEQEKSFNGTL